MQLLSIRQVFTSGFRPRLNRAMERTHRFLNAALAIYCEHQQEKWEDYLQSAVYAHNISPISGTSNITPFFLVFGRDAPSPESNSLALPPKPLPPDHYAKHICMYSYVYDTYPASQEILACHGRLKGLVKSCPFLQMDGATSGGTYIHYNIITEDL